MISLVKQYIASTREAVSSEKGATLVEYVMIAAVIGLGLVAILSPLRTALTSKIQEIVTAITGAGT